MPLGYNIKIARKVVNKHDKVEYYLDSNNTRLYENEIKYIIKSHRLPPRISYMNGGFKYVGINMTELSNGTLRCRCGKIIKERIQDRGILIIIEDSGSGFVFYKEVIERLYPLVKFTFMTSNGNKGLYRVYRENYDKYRNVIVVSDNKITDDKYLQNIVDIKMIASTCKGMNTFIFKPLSVEEVIMSAQYLRVNNSNNLRNDILQYMESGKLYYRIQNNCYEYRGVKVENMEKFLFSTLTKLSSLSYTKSGMQRCFILECCSEYIITDKSDINSRATQCKNYRNVSGYRIFRSSLMEGIHNILTRIFNTAETGLKKWNAECKSELYYKI